MISHINTVWNNNNKWYYDCIPQLTSESLDDPRVNVTASAASVTHRFAFNEDTDISITDRPDVILELSEVTYGKQWQNIDGNNNNHSNNLLATKLYYTDGPKSKPNRQ